MAERHELGSYREAAEQFDPPNRYGPAVTFLGVPRANLREPETFQDADAVVIGAPFDGGTTFRAGARFGPLAIRSAD